MGSIADLASCAAEHLDQYCSDPAFAWPAYDEDPSPTSFTVTDLLAPALLNAPVTRQHALSMAHGGDEHYRMLWDAMRSAVEDERAHDTVFEDIADLDSDETWKLVHAAFDACQDTPFIKTATVSKILHRKLQRLVPINDRWVREFYGVGHRHTWNLWSRLRDDINANRTLIDNLRHGRSTPSGRPMTRLRCMEIIVWMHVKRERSSM